jgi:hypothetical protein
MDILEAISEADLQSLWDALGGDATPDRRFVVAYPGADNAGLLSRDPQGQLQFSRLP